MTIITFFASILLTFILLLLIFYFGFQTNAGTKQIFDDFIFEHLSVSGFNKSGEISFLYQLAGYGILFSILIFLLLYKYQKDTPSSACKNPTSKTAFAIAVLPALFHFLIFQRISIACCLGFLFLIFVLITQKSLKYHFPSVGLLCILSYYGVLSTLTVLVHFSTKFIISQKAIYFLAGLTAAFIFVFQSVSNISMKKICLILELFTPFLLVLFFVDRYLYKGELLRIAYAPFYYIFFAVLLLGSLCILFFHLYKSWKNADTLSLQNILHPIVPILIFIYNSYSSCPMYAQPDQHHHGEQFIPWQQVIDLSRSLYEEYTPASGLFPMLNGFIQNILLGGTVSDYSPSISITVVLFSIITMYFICKHAGPLYGLLFSIFFALPAYNRQYMVLPILLLLFYKPLLANPGRFLKVWILSCLLAGLYYPLFGGAALIGSAPLGLYVFLRYIKETDFKSELKSPKFYIFWILSLLPVACSIPLLIKMAEHTLLFAKQTILSEGISLYGQSSPDFFMPYLSGNSIKDSLYITLRFFLPILPLLLCSVLSAFALIKYKKEKENTTLIFFLSMLCAILTLLVSYTYTIVRADENVILSRTAPILIAIAGIFVPCMTIRYGKKIVPVSVRILLLGICFSFPMIIYHQVSAMKFPDMWVYPNGNASLVMDDADKLFTYYTVPDGFIRMEEVSINDKSMLGQGFMIADQIHYLNQYENIIAKCSALDSDITYLNFDGQGFYYYLNVPACGTGFIPIAKGKDAQNSLLKQVAKERPVIFPLNPLQSYHIFYWMLTNDYCYNSKDCVFYPAELYQKIYPDNPDGDDYRLFCESTSLNNSPSSFGISAQTLSSLMDEEKFLSIETTTNPISIRGLDYDILFLNIGSELFETASAIDIRFLADGKEYEGSSVTCFITNNELLIPMGMNANWLTSENSKITIHFLDEQQNPILSVPIEDVTKHGISATFLQMKH